MQKIDSFEEVKFTLKHYEIVTITGKDSFYYRDGYVVHKFDGNIFRVKFDVFCDLYKDTTFYYPEEEQETVDPGKDEEYYGRIQKHN